MRCWPSSAPRRCRRSSCYPSTSASDEFLGDPANRLDLWLEPGQIQILNNRVIVHGRTPYEDHDEPERRRHLVRLWLRAGDRRHFRG